MYLGEPMILTSAPRVRHPAPPGSSLSDEAEVEHLDEVVVLVALHQKDVARLDVAVDDAERVGLAERAADLPRDVDRALGRRARPFLSSSARVRPSRYSIAMKQLPSAVSP